MTFRWRELCFRVLEKSWLPLFRDLRCPCEQIVMRLDEHVLFDFAFEMTVKDVALIMMDFQLLKMEPGECTERIVIRRERYSKERYPFLQVTVFWREWDICDFVFRRWQSMSWVLLIANRLTSHNWLSNFREHTEWIFPCADYVNTHIWRYDVDSRDNEREREIFTIYDIYRWLLIFSICAGTSWWTARTTSGDIVTEIGTIQ